ncbi:MAG: ABC transporter ATP-binding protein [Acetobacteraceae bacterium]
MADKLLTIEDLSVSYATPRGWLRAVDRLSLSIARGEALGLVGESGSGKSSVVLAILGLLGPGARMKASRAVLGGADLLREAAALRGLRIGVVFQDPSAALNPALPIGIQVIEPMLVHRRMSRNAAMQRGTALLVELGIVRAAEMMRLYPHQLSGGMKQRAMIATALSAEPDLLLLDEPTTALDVTVEAQILDLLENLRQRRGLAMLLVSHNLGIVDRICDRITVLYAGRTVETGSATDVLARPAHPYTRGLLRALPRPDPRRIARLVPIPGSLPDMVDTDPGCNFRARCAYAADECERPQQLRPIAPGHNAGCHRAGADAGLMWHDSEMEPEVSVRAGPAGLLVNAVDLTKTFRSGRWLVHNKSVAPAVDHMSIHIGSGEILGLVGESGCGKTTLGRLLLRLIAADAGRITFAGAELPTEPGPEFRRRAQIVFQNPDTSLNPRKTVGATLRRPLERFGIAHGAAAGDEVSRLLALVRIPISYADRYPHELSGGEKQRVSIARALATRPDFLVCDEAVSALDVSVQAAVLNLLHDLRDGLGLALLFISHDIGVIAHIADRVIVMYRGRAVEAGPTAEVLRPPYHPYTEALLSAVPIVGGRDVERVRLPGDPGSAKSAEGCCFSARCPRRLGTVCDTVPPPWQQSSAAHDIACHIPITELAAMPPQLQAAE